MNITIEHVLPDVLFMDELFSIEFIRNRSTRSTHQTNFLHILHEMSSDEHRGTQVFEIDSGDGGGGGGGGGGGSIIVAPSKGETTHAFLCSVLWPFLDSYYVAAVTLFTLLPIGKISKDDLALRAQWLSEALYHDRKISHYESCSLDTLRNALRTYERMGVIGVAPNDPPPIPVAANETDPTRIPLSPVLVQLMPKYCGQGILQNFVARIGRLRKTADPLVTGEDEAMMAATTMAELPMIGKARL